MQSGECDITCLPERGNVGEYRLGEPRRTGQQPGALCGVRPDERGFEQLANDSEAEPTLEFPSTCGPHGHPQRAGAFAKLVEQRSFADPRRPLDQQDAAHSADRLRQSGIDRGEIVLTIKKQRPLA